jgi:hypothetical protein
MIQLVQSLQSSNKLMGEGWTISEVFPEFLANGFDPVVLHLQRPPVRFAAAVSTIARSAK